MTEYITQFRRTMTSGYRMRRRCRIGRTRALWVTWCDAWHFTWLLRWARRRPGPDGEGGE